MENIQEKEIKIRDEEAEKFEEWYFHKGKLFDWIEKKLIIKSLDLSEGDIVLDAGCGTGRITREIAKRCKKVYGFDFSSLSIKVLNERLGKEGLQNIETSVCDITKHFLLTEKVDKIVSVQVIQHIPGEIERLKTLRNFYNQLKSGGKCLISVYNYNPFLYPGLLKEGKFSKDLYYFRFTPQEARILLEKAGFKNISIRGCVNFRGYSFLGNLYKLFYALANLDIFLSKFKFSCSLGHFLVCKGTK